MNTFVVTVRAVISAAVTQMSAASTSAIALAVSWRRRGGKTKGAHTGGAPPVETGASVPPHPPAHVGVVLPPGTSSGAVAALVTAAVSSGVVRSLSVHDPSGELLAAADGRGEDGEGGLAAAIAEVRQRLPAAVRRRVLVGGWGTAMGTRKVVGGAVTTNGSRAPAESVATAVVFDDAGLVDDADDDSSSDRMLMGAEVPLFRPLRLPVTLVVGVDGRDGIAAAARTLAAIPPAARSADGVVRPPTAASVGAWLDRGAAATAAAADCDGGGTAAAAAAATPWALPGGEPDVVVLFRGPGMLPCLGGFPPWQLRLALLWEPPRCGWLRRGGCGVADLGVAGVTAAVAAARAASRRFGS
ncbi:hypothetical protein MMPV_005938 [Pyropia vietnamensis]